MKTRKKNLQSIIYLCTRCQYSNRTRKGASPSLELVKISEVVRAPRLIRVGRDEWGGLVLGGVEATWEPTKTASLSEPFVRPVKTFSSQLSCLL